jgi:hypothetical protein
MPILPTQKSAALAPKNPIDACVKVTYLSFFLSLSFSLSLFLSLSFSRSAAKKPIDTRVKVEFDQHLSQQDAAAAGYNSFQKQ